VSISGVGQLRGRLAFRTGVLPVIFPSKTARRTYSRRLGLEEKKNRGSLKKHDEARREEAEEHEEALLHREADSLHGKTKAKSSRFLSFSLSLSLSFALSLFPSLFPSRSNLCNSIRTVSLLIPFSFFPFFLPSFLSRSSSLILFNSPSLSAFPSFPFDASTFLDLASSLYRALSASLSFSTQIRSLSIFHSRHRYRKEGERKRAERGSSVTNNAGPERMNKGTAIRRDSF